MYFAGFHLLERYNCLWSRMGHSNRLAGQSIPLYIAQLLPQYSRGLPAGGHLKKPVKIAVLQRGAPSGSLQTR